MYQGLWVFLTAAGWAWGTGAGVVLAGAAEEPTKGRYACEQVFTFGLHGCELRPYDLGLEGLLRDMRRHAMNCLVCGLSGGEGAEGIARLKQEVALCRR